MAANKTDRKQFLWVNKDEASVSLSKSDPSESKRIFEFVQRQRSDHSSKQKSSQRRHGSLASGTTAQGSGQPMLGRFRLPQVLNIRPSDSSEQPDLRTSAASGQDREQTTGADDSQHPTNTQTVNEWLNQGRLAWRRVPSQNYNEGSGVDPFSATPVPITKNVEVLLKYHLVMSTTGSHVDKIEVLPPHLQPVQRYSKVREILLGNCMQEKIALTSLLMIMAARMVHLSRIPLVGSAKPEHYMQMALTSVRERMFECQQKGIRGDRTLVHAMHALALAAWICQYFEEASTHIRAAKLLLPLLDLSDAYDVYAVQGLVNVDKMIAIETGNLPDMPFMFDPGPLGSPRMKTINDEIADYAEGRRQPVICSHSPVPDANKLANALMNHQIDILADASAILHFKLGRGFERALDAKVIQPALASILQDTLDCLTVAKFVWRTSDATKDDADWMCKRMRAICRRLLALPASLSTLGSSENARKTESLRIAILLVVLRCTNRMSFRSAQPNMRRLMHALYGIDTNWSDNTSSAEAEANLPRCLEALPAHHVVSPTSSHLSESLEVLPTLRAEKFDENALLLWILLTGHFNAQGEVEESWFLMRAAFVAQYHLHLRNYDDLHEFMGEFFYSSIQQQSSLVTVSLYLQQHHYD